MVHENNGSNRNIGLYIIAAAMLSVVLLSAIGAGFYFYLESKKDSDAYFAAKTGGNKINFQRYLDQFPSGKYVADAQLAMDELDWQATPKNVAGYIAYLKERPTGTHAQEARQKADDQAWEEYGVKGGISGLRRYVEMFPDGKNAQLAKNKIEQRLSCNRAYAQNELSNAQRNGGAVQAESDGAANIYSRKQGTAYSTTHFSGDTATTYHHDGSYTSQDGVEVRYRISNNSKFLILDRVEGTVSFRTKAGVFWRGLVGGWLGAAASATKDPDRPINEGAAAGAKKGYEMAKHSESVVITQTLAPGETYQGRAYLSSKYKVLNSEFAVGRIQARISESLLEKKNAPGC